MTYFNYSTNKALSLYHDSLGLLGIDESNTTTFPIATFTRYANAWYRRFIYYIWRSSGQWQFDDTNYTTLPEATADLVAGQEDYALPSTAIDVLEAYILDSDGDYKKLERINPNTLPTSRDEYLETDGTPAEYWLEGGSVIIKPAPAAGSVTTTAGLKIILDRDIDAFTITDTTQEPGLPNPFHRIISLGASFDFARANDMANKIKTIQPDLDRMIGELTDYYARRSRNQNKKIRPKISNTSI
jgi:hypothetical protein